MKKVLTTAGFLAVVATPAFAQSYSASFGTGNVINQPALEQQVRRTDGASAYAQAPQKKTGPSTAIDRYGPSANGGGSEGYNWGLEHNY